jgi:hypothetical protein
VVEIRPALLVVSRRLEKLDIPTTTGVFMEERRIWANASTCRSGEEGAYEQTEARLFAQALLGKPVRNVSRVDADARAKREQLG